MLTLKSSSTKSPFRIRAKGIQAKDLREGTATDRQHLIPGFDQGALSRARIGLVGAGGINSEIGLGLVRKGAGEMVIFDDDIVTMSNFSRQRFFQRDLYRNKAHRLARNLAQECVAPTVITGHSLRFEDALDGGIPMDCDLYVFGVDNNPGRVAGCRALLDKIPVVFLGTGPTANNGYVMVQEPSGPCFACLFPQSLESRGRVACSPSSIDILKPIAGLALYAVDSLLMRRPRRWNYREVFLDGSPSDRTLMVERDPECPVCGVASP